MECHITEGVGEEMAVYASHTIRDETRLGLRVGNNGAV